MKFNLKELIREILTETMVGNNDIKACKGKAIKTITGNNNSLEITLDDDSKLVINTTNPKELLHYRLERGMLQTNGSNLSSHGNKPMQGSY